MIAGDNSYVSQSGAGGSQPLETVVGTGNGAEMDRVAPLIL
jgi:hypothetical protein